MLQYPGTRHPNYYEFPVVTTVGKTGRNQYWQIFAGIVKSDTPNDFAKGISPPELTVLSEKLAPIYDKSDYVIDPMLKGYRITASWTDVSVPKLKTATFITSGKNMKKKNRTNTWTQTMADAFSQYESKNKPNEKLGIVLPMLAFGEAIPDADLEAKIGAIFEKHKGEIRTQIKYDGLRLMIKISPDGGIFPYSRTGDMLYISDELRSELKIIANTIRRFSDSVFKDKTVYLDGEYYLHGMQLQYLSGAVRKESQSEEKSRLIYHIFDIVITDDQNRIAPYTCEHRLWFIKLLRDYYTTYGFTKIIFVASRKPSDARELIADFREKKTQGYEGLIIRVLSAPYESNRSQAMIKVKSSFRDEFRIVGYKEATGKQEGMIIFKCALTEDTIRNANDYMIEQGKPVTEVDITLPKDVTFNVAPALPDVERRQMMENADSYIGKLYTVEFQDWTAKLKPARPKGIAIFE